jgi:hypothetical protein
MEVETNCPHCNAENSYDINLVEWLGSITNFEYKSDIVIDPLTIYVRPYSYRELSQTSLKTLEHQRIFSVINDEDLTDELKVAKFGQSFVKLTELTVDIIAGCVAQIDTPDGSSKDPEQIKEFIHNSPKQIFDMISNHITEMKKSIEIPNQIVKCNECTKEFEMPVSMDQSNFFGERS